MTLPEYICELLYRYNCVIIPEFGAFLTQRIPATFDKDGRVFSAPSKEISFNEQISKSDGLLANYIAKKENITFENAIYKIKQFVQETTNRLINNENVSFNEIGNFHMNQEKNLIFNPKYNRNYLAESFGLASLEAFQITREKPVITINTTNVVKTKKSGYLLKYAAVGVLLLGISGIAINSHKKSIETQKTEQFVEVENEINKHLQSASFVLNVEEILPSILLELEKPKKEINSTNYHVIAGAFREYNNALRKLNQLSKQGYKASYVGKNNYGLHQVAYHSFSKKNKAINYLNHLKKTKNSSAWLLTLNN